MSSSHSFTTARQERKNNATGSPDESPETQDQSVCSYAIKVEKTQPSDRWQNSQSSHAAADRMNDQFTTSDTQADVLLGLRNLTQPPPWPYVAPQLGFFWIGQNGVRANGENGRKIVLSWKIAANQEVKLACSHRNCAWVERSFYREKCFFIIYIQRTKLIPIFQNRDHVTLINLKSTSPTEAAFILPQF
jgi:hypothetical protein